MSLREEIANLLEYYFFKHSNSPGDWRELHLRLEKFKGSESTLGFMQHEKINNEIR